MKRIIILMIALAGIIPDSFSQLNLEECRRLARENYPAIKQFDLIEKSKDMNLSNAARAYLPQFSITGMANLIDGIPEIEMPGMEKQNNNYKFIGMANLKQPVWDGGATKARKKSAEANAEVEKQNIEVMLFQLNERVNQLYFGILMLDERLKQIDIMDDNLSRNLKKAETAQANGVAFQSDLDAIKVEMLNSAQNRINLNAQRSAYLQMLSVMINRNLPENTALNIPAEIAAFSEEINRPELKLYEQQRLYNDAQNAMISARNMPKIGLAGYAIGLTPDIDFSVAKLNRLLMAGLSVSWDISGLYTTKNDRNILEINKMKIDNQQEIFMFNMRLELEESRSSIERSRQLMQQDDEIVRLRERIKQASEIKYENGACTMTDLLNDISAENAARQNKALHRIEYLMNLYKYKTTSGN